ncbi:MAG: ribosome maturation factor RimM [Clostridia bacterium]|nr:ribosome maturation factor RimM [Clostridia bacterium]
MDEWVRVGQIVSTQGLRGEVRVYPFTDYKERFEELDYVHLEDDTDLILEIENVRYKGQLIILKFKDLNNINHVEKFKDRYIAIDRDKMRELPEDSYYISDLVGLNIIDEDNSCIGKLVDVIQNTAQDIYIIEHHISKSKILIPAVKEFIKEVDMEEKVIKVKLIEGMIE